jgi:hypothetical protein
VNRQRHKDQKVAIEIGRSIEKAAQFFVAKEQLTLSQRKDMEHDHEI